MAKLSKNSRFAQNCCSDEQRVLILNSLDRIRGLFTTDMLCWLAKLFDPETGGFYYSNSARDNEGFLPDIESTNQVLAILERSGVISSYDDMPSLIKREIAFFVCQREDSETGLFFHPQWKYEVSKSHLPRLSRDLTAAYDLSLGLSFELPAGEGGTKKVLSGLKKKGLAEYLSSKETLLSFLENMPLNHESASFISSQFCLLESAGLQDAVCDWLISKQDKDTGFFDDHNARESVSTFHALSWFFISCKRYIPNSDKAVANILKHLTSDHVGTITYASACWRSLYNILNNIKTYVSDSEDIIKEIIEEIYSSSEKALKNTYDVLKSSKRSDGSFSYMPDRATPISHGMHVAASDKLEGDVNATLLAVGTLISVYGAFELDSVKTPIFSHSDFAYFLENIRLF